MPQCTNLILMLNIFYRTRDKTNAHRKEIKIEIEKGRRHSNDRRNEEKSSNHYHVSQHNLDGSKKNTLGSLEEIKRGYSEIGYKFIQIWNPATQKYLQVDPENTSVGLTENISSFNSKYTQ